MKKIFTLWALLAAFAFVSCDDDDPIPPPEPLPTKIELAAAEVTVENAGGKVQLGYTITHPREDAQFKASTTADWITGFDFSEQGIITFMVAANTGFEPREAVVDLTYPETEALKFTVKQGATPRPTLELQATTVEVEAAGGEVEMGYTLTHPTEGDLPGVSSTADWITGFDTSKAGVILLQVAANEVTEPREAVVEVTYPNISSALNFTVKQAAAAPRPDFEITLKDATTNSFVMTLIPKDPAMHYFYHVIPATTAAKYPTDDELYAYDVAFYEDMDYGVGLGWQAWAMEDVHQGAITDYKVTSMIPDTEYVVYAYGTSMETLERTTPILRVNIRTEKPQMVDAEFHIELIDDTAAETRVKVTAKGYDGFFVAKIYHHVKEGDTDETVKEKISQYWIDEVKTAGWIGYTPENIIAEHGAKNQTEATRSVDPGQKCYAYAFAIDENALRCSEITILPFTAK